ncbi:imelysin family protein [Oceaniglobus trochenteri]|uniref:imelysin family protein n=1 Tax=Oceaniglobus trochenteri TaxID=2763260 RepID=UPI001CFFCC6A|nr:imelysin family protein [Oceaniglobus trochenteri]
MRFLPALALYLSAAPALAGVGEVTDDHIFPGYTAFAAATETLTETARGDCTAGALRPAYQDAFDAWMGVSHLRLGPVETDGRILAISFWPDSRNLTESSLRRLIAEQDGVVDTPGAYGEVSIAARGLMALDRLLYDDTLAGYGADSYTCRLVTAITADLDAMADAVLAEWQQGYADTLRSAGDPENTTFLSQREAAQALFTVLTTALEFDADQRIGRPMGTFERPRPTRAEAWRSGRSLRNVELSLVALRDLALKLSQDEPAQTLAAFDDALAAARDLDDPVFAGVEDPGSRFKIEILQQKIRAAKGAVTLEIGAGLGVSAGFNSADGD